MQSPPSPKVPLLPEGWIVVNHGKVQAGDMIPFQGIWVPVTVMFVGNSPKDFSCVIRKAQ